MNYRQRLIIISLIDICLIFVAIHTSFLLRFDFQIRAEFYTSIYVLTFVEVVLVFLIFYWKNVYRLIWQFASISELLKIINAITFVQVMLTIAAIFVTPLLSGIIIPRSIFLISWPFMIIGIGGSRMMLRFLLNYQAKMKPFHQPALIVGAGSAGAMIAKELMYSRKFNLFPVAFIDDQSAKQNLSVMGLPVLGRRDDIPDIVKKHNIKDIIIAIPSASEDDRIEIIEICNQTKCNVKILPSVGGMLEYRESAQMIRDVKIEDLLGRDPIQTDLTEISQRLYGETVLVTGAGGSIGSELSRQLADYKPERLLLLDHEENSLFSIEMELKKRDPSLRIVSIIADIRDRKRIMSIFEFYRPTYIYHAAAHKHVPFMELNPSEAVKNNILGTKNVAEAADQFGASNFVLISTDKAVNPTSVMGATKRVAEMLIQGLDRMSKTVFVAVRFGNVLGSNGSVVPIFKKQIAEGGPLTVTHPEMIRFFMTIPEAVQLVIQSSIFAEGGEIFILDMGKPVKILTLAKKLISLSGLELDKDIKIIYTGIRPGEKLYEEMLTHEEGLHATKHNRIFVCQPSTFNLDELLQGIEQFQWIVNTLENNDDLQSSIREQLKMMVHTYQYEEFEPHHMLEAHSTISQNPIAAHFSQV